MNQAKKGRRKTNRQQAEELSATLPQAARPPPPVRRETRSHRPPLSPPIRPQPPDTWEMWASTPPHAASPRSPMTTPGRHAQQQWAPTSFPSPAFIRQMMAGMVAPQAQEEEMARDPPQAPPPGGEGPEESLESASESEFSPSSPPPLTFPEHITRERAASSVEEGVRLGSMDFSDLVLLLQDAVPAISSAGGDNYHRALIAARWLIHTGAIADLAAPTLCDTTAQTTITTCAEAECQVAPTSKEAECQVAPKTQATGTTAAPQTATKKTGTITITTKHRGCGNTASPTQEVGTETTPVPRKEEKGTTTEPTHVIQQEEKSTITEPAPVTQQEEKGTTTEPFSEPHQRRRKRPPKWFRQRQRRPALLPTPPPHLRLQPQHRQPPHPRQRPAPRPRIDWPPPPPPYLPRPIFNRPRFPRPPPPPPPPLLQHLLEWLAHHHPPAWR